MQVSLALQLLTRTLSALGSSTPNTVRAIYSPTRTDEREVERSDSATPIRGVLLGPFPARLGSLMGRGDFQRPESAKRQYRIRKIDSETADEAERPKM